MPYYSVDLPKPTCPDCGARATKEVRTPTNETIGRYCAPCAYAKITDLNRRYIENLARGT